MTVVAASEVFYVGFAELWDLAGRRALASAERQRGADASRPRIKFVDIREMLAATG